MLGSTKNASMCPVLFCFALYFVDHDINKQMKMSINTSLYLVQSRTPGCFFLGNILHQFRSCHHDRSRLKAGNGLLLQLNESLTLISLIHTQPFSSEITRKTLFPPYLPAFLGLSDGSVVEDVVLLRTIVIK